MTEGSGAASGATSGWAAWAFGMRVAITDKTTSADIAEAADVPVGNVYYYFKTGDRLDP